MPIVAQFPGGGGGDSMKLSGLVMAGTPTKTVYMDGDTFNPAGMTFEASYSLAGVPFTTVDVSDQVVFTPTPLTAGTTTVVATFQDKADKYTKDISGITVHRKLARIEVTTNPTLQYRYGDAFNTAGMVVEAVYQTGGGTTEERAPITGYTISPANGAILNPTISGSNLSATQTATLTYTENGITKTTDLTITVARKKVTIPTWIGTLRYTGSSQSANSTGLWNNYDTTYMTIGGTYSGTNAGDYEAKFTPKDNYCWPDDSITAASATWNIGRQKITTEPSPNALTFTGAEQTVTWNNYNSTQLTLSGTTKGTNATSYTAKFTPTSNYCWSDDTFGTRDKTWTIGKKSVTVPTLSATTFTYNGSAQGPTVNNTTDSAWYTQSGTLSSINATTTDFTVTWVLNDKTNTQWAGGTSTADKSQTWKINKATITPSISPTTLNIVAGGLTQSATISYSPNCYDGTPTKDTNSYSGLTAINLTKTSFSVTGDGATGIDGKQIKITFPGTSNCTVSTSPLTVTVNATYFSWPVDQNTSKTSLEGVTWEKIHELCEAEAAGSKNITDYIAVGATKTMNHDSLLGATSEQVKVIGINYDKAHSITIQTTNMLPTYAKFNGNLSSGSNVQWTNADYWWKNMNGDNQVRGLCKKWASTCDAKNYIQTVQKYTAGPTTATSQSAAVDAVEALDETGFLPSIAEVNLKTYSSYNGGTGYNEYPVYNTGTKGANGSAYPAYTDNNSRIKKQGDSGSANRWWTRSRSSYRVSAYGYGFGCSVCNDGSGGGDGAWYGIGLAPAAVVA